MFKSAKWLASNIHNENRKKEFNDGLTQDDVDSLLFWIDNFEDNEIGKKSYDLYETTSHLIKDQVHELTYKPLKPESQKIIEQKKNRNFRILPNESIEFPKGFRYNWKIIKLHLYIVSRHAFYIPEDIYKKVKSHIHGDKRFFTRREFDEILEYIEKKYWLNKRDIHKR